MRLERLGTHTRPRPPRRGRLVLWWTLAGLLTWLVATGHQSACQQAIDGQPVNAMMRLCYSDIPLKYQGSLAQGQSPFAGGLDQAPLVGLVVALVRGVTSLFHPVERQVAGQSALDAANTFFTLTQLVLFAALLVLLRAHLVASGRPLFDRSGRELPRPGMVRGVVAILVTTVTAGMISWELLAAALMVWAIACWRTERMPASALLTGLAFAAHGHALALVVAMMVAVLVTRPRQARSWLLFAALGWLVPTVPVLVGWPQGWASWVRGLLLGDASLGSLWWVIAEARPDLPAGQIGSVLDGVGVWRVALPLTVLLWGVIVARAVARRWPPEQTAAVLLAAVFVLAPGYTPQQALLLVPLVALARPTRAVLVLAVTEAWYWVMVFTKLNGSLMAGPGGQDRSYWVAVVLRVAVELWVLVTLAVDDRRRTWTPEPRAVAEPASDDLRPDDGGEALEVEEAPADPVEESLTEPAPASASWGTRTRTFLRRDDVRFYGLVWAASRLALALTLIWTSGAKDRPLLKAISAWDVEHYAAVALHGYANRQEVAFFPGLPLVMRVLHFVGITPAAGGVLVALVCSLLSGWALHRLGGIWAAGLWLVAPATVFTFVGYSEAPFCAAAFWAWERARSRHWGQAAVLAAVACSIRVSGLFLVGALVVLAIVGNGPDHAPARRFTQRLANARWLVLPVLVLAGYATYLHHLTGSWTAWFDAQAQHWGREFTWPWQSFEATWKAAQPAAWPGRERVASMFLAEIVSMAAGVATTVVCLVRRRWAEASWVAVQVVAFATSNWWMSTNRAVLLWFPTWLLLAAAARELVKPDSDTTSDRGGRLMVVLVAVLGLVVVSLGWANWYFAGEWAS